MTTPPCSPPRPQQQGFTLLEALLVMSIVGILFGLGMVSFQNLRNPARDTARAVHSALFQLRADAAANTQARRMVLNSAGELELQSALKCDETNQNAWTLYSKVDLPERLNRRPVTLSREGGALSPNVIVCYSPRGLATVNGQLNIDDTKARYSVQVALSGGIKTRAQ
ncbi:type II secretion system protein [Deinococcus multiflagellatus]|uniref:type II secretion system protein n=1 Tax=Deinococcus multiflagellatus TaxID=1656887 RepID=UPI001CCA70FB|nr:prepilin-type N-terminal cleavage/methylation domain-containing protein [Deinococcus multiflagellatus]MBZ9713859.1 prepilin-type N-terminal cleavage/methylation domain-containing protein [Deinococcus multiflagellatus]